MPFRDAGKHFEFNSRFQNGSFVKTERNIIQHISIGNIVNANDATRHCATPGKIFLPRLYSNLRQISTKLKTRFLFKARKRVSKIG
jgi:hypothetical protein